MTETEIDYYEGRNRKNFGRDTESDYITGTTEGLTNRADVTMTSRTDTSKTYLGETKDYTISGFQRPHNIYENYQIDYEKIKYLYLEALKEKRIPFLYVRFTDETFIWVITPELFNKLLSTVRCVPVNKYGLDYGKEKEFAEQVYFDFSDAVRHYKTRYYE